MERLHFPQKETSPFSHFSHFPFTLSWADQIYFLNNCVRRAAIKVNLHHQNVTWLTCAQSAVITQAIN